MMVYPAPGLRVRDPVTKAHIPETGHEVPDGDLFWARRLRDGDVTLDAPEPSTEEAASLPSVAEVSESMKGGSQS